MPRKSTEMLWDYYRSRVLTGASSTWQRNRIAEAHCMLVRKIAWRMVGQSAEPYEDLYQLGHEGLLTAIEKFDPTLGNAFSSFAVPYIRGSILHFLRDHGSTVKVPRRWRELNAECNRAEKVWALEQGRLPTEEELSRAVGQPMAAIRRAREAIAHQSPDLLNEEIHDCPQIVELEQPIPDLREWLTDLAADLERLEPGERRLIETIYMGQAPLKNAVAGQHPSAIKIALNKSLDNLSELHFRRIYGQHEGASTMICALSSAM